MGMEHVELTVVAFAVAPSLDILVAIVCLIIMVLFAIYVCDKRLEVFKNLIVFSFCRLFGLYVQRAWRLWDQWSLQLHGSLQWH